MAYSTAGHGPRRLRQIPNYFDVPVKLVRILVVLSIFFGLALYILPWLLTSFCDLRLIQYRTTWPWWQLPSGGELLDEVDRELAASETHAKSTLFHLRYFHVTSPFPSTVGKL